MPETMPLVVGPITLTIGRLKLGEFKRVREHLSVVEKIQWAKGTPTNEEIEALVVMLWTSASKFDPALSLEEVRAAFDDLDFLDSVDLLSQGFVMLLKSAGVPDPEERPPGEAPSQPS